MVRLLVVGVGRIDELLLIRILLDTGCWLIALLLHPFFTTKSLDNSR